MPILLLLIALGILVFIVMQFIKDKRKNKWKTPREEFPQQWRAIIKERIVFYHQLSDGEKEVFEFKVFEFLLNCRITGIRTKVDITDKILVASGAIIPIIGFPEWKYHNVKDVLIFEDAFNKEFMAGGEGQKFNGMVGSHFLENKMLLSKKALHFGFDNKTDKNNTTIHEFVHLIDKADGVVDGLPQLLLEQNNSIPWLNLIQEKIKEIQNQRSDIDPYGATKPSEFFAVASEYFFERPHLFEKKHPQLYSIMQDIFDHDIAARKKISIAKVEVGRNNLCPCGSKQKFKKCCAS